MGKNKREDLIDRICLDCKSKWYAVARECYRKHLTRRPILVGTTSIENSERLCTLLEEFSLTPKLLNARPENVKKEAQIISNSGALGSITISTNIAGRGTDIVLGGDLTIMLRLHICSTLKALHEFLKD